MSDKKESIVDALLLERDKLRVIADRDATIAALTERAEAAERELHECRVVGYVHGYMAKEPVHEWLARRLAYLEPRSERTSIAEAARAELERRARAVVEGYSATETHWCDVHGDNWRPRCNDCSVDRANHAAQAANVNALAELLPASSAKPAPKLAWERDEDGEVWIANHNGLLLRVDGVPGQHVLWEVVGRAHVPSGTIPAPSDGGPIDRAKVDAAKVAAERAAGVQHEGSEHG